MDGMVTGGGGTRGVLFKAQRTKDEWNDIALSGGSMTGFN